MSYLVKVGSVTLNQDVLLDVKLHLAHAMVGETLESDTSTVTYREKDPNPPLGFVTADTEEVMLDANGAEFWVSDEYEGTGLIPSSLTDGVVMECVSNGSTVVRHFFDSYKQTGKNKYTLYGLSVIGVLASKKHYGGMYTNTPVATVLADILSGYKYSVDASVADLTITGYLPISTKRDNLQQVLFAIGATISTNADGSLQIYSMSNVVTSTLNKSKCFMDGNVQLSNPVTGVQLTEHNYFESSEVVTLYDSGIYGTETIEFSEPYHDLVVSGAKLVESGVNYAVITGNGAATLTGKKYIHVTRVVTAADSKSGNIKQVDSAYLANPAVAQSLADRVFGYLKNNVTISQDILFEQERAGDVVSIIDPYTDKMVTACTKELDISLSELQRASGKFLVGFVPQGAISGYQNYVLLTGSGSWKVPDGVTNIRVILVGAGSGGDGGYNGTDGESGYVSDRIDATEAHGGAGGQGGKAGNAGSGGKIFEVSVNVTSGATLSYVCGTAGTGGSTNGGKGTAGGATTLGQLSSESGRVYADGYKEVKTGLTFGKSGTSSIAGAAGGNGSDGTGDEAKGTNGASVSGYTGGTGGTGDDYGTGADGRNRHSYGGGGGGGAANGSNGSNGTNRAVGGNGGNGNAGANGTNYGDGGGAGNGGGGGGGGSYYIHYNVNLSDYIYYDAIGGGTGGTGGAGGNGYAGCIVIYY